MQLHNFKISRRGNKILDGIFVQNENATHKCYNNSVIGVGNSGHLSIQTKINRI